MLQLLTKKQKGFTLIELLVVIAIIGILASIVLVSMGGARKSARDATRKADMRQLVTAQEMHYGNNDDYYTCSTTAGDCGGKTDNYPSTVAAGGNTYMASTPKDPTNSGTYVYKGWSNTGSGEDQKFCYYAALETNPATYYTASHGGNFTKTSAPTSLDNCATQ